MEHLHIWRRIVNVLYCSDPCCNAKSKLELQDGKLVKCYNCRSSFLFDASYFQDKMGNLQCPECGDSIPTLTLERQQKILNEIISQDVFKTIERKAEREMQRVSRKEGRSSAEFEEQERELAKRAEILERRSKELDELRDTLEKRFSQLRLKREQHKEWLLAKRKGLKIRLAQMEHTLEQERILLQEQRKTWKAYFEDALHTKRLEMDAKMDEWKATYAAKKTGRPNGKPKVEIQGLDVVQEAADKAIEDLIRGNLKEENG